MKMNIFALIIMIVSVYYIDYDVDHEHYYGTVQGAHTLSQKIKHISQVQCQRLCRGAPPTAGE